MATAGNITASKPNPAIPEPQVKSRAADLLKQMKQRGDVIYEQHFGAPRSGRTTALITATIAIATPMQITGGGNRGAGHSVHAVRGDDAAAHCRGGGLSVAESGVWA